MIFCPLYSGSSGNSIFVSSDKASILIDAGLSGKKIEKALCDIGKNAKELDGIFVTHEHIDHIKGIGVLSRRYNIPIYANKLTWESMGNSIGKIKEHNIKVIQDKYISVSDLDIESFSISHDAVDPKGYVVRNGKKKVCVATDMGYFTEEVKEAIVGSDVILIESNHDVEMLKFGPYPYPLKRRILGEKGHLSNEECSNAIASLLNNNTKTIFLGHLSKTNNYPDLAYQTAVNILSEHGIKIGQDINLSVALRDKHSEYVNF